MEHLEELLAELLLSPEEGGKMTVEERFLMFLVMEPFIRSMRKEGKSNLEILRLCQHIDGQRNAKR